MNTRATGADKVAIERLAYEQGLRAIDIQVQTLADLRTRAGTVLAAASLVTSFLGAPALERHQQRVVWLALAVVLLIGQLGMTVSVLTGRKFSFRQRPKKILADLDSGGYTDEGQALSTLAGFLEEDHDQNEKKLGSLDLHFRVACALLISETVALILAL